MTTTEFNDELELANLQHRGSDLVAERAGLPLAVAEPTLVTYRSFGIGIFGVVMRFAGMPLEKVALFMNSSQVSGKGQFRQAFRLTFKDGALAPYKVVGPASLTAWFFQYSAMGFAFQFFDRGLSKMLIVKPVYYGHELMQPPVEEDISLNYRLKSTFKTCLSPMLAAALETQVSNRAEVQRFFGREQFTAIERSLKLNPLSKTAGPAFAPCMMRNLIMCQTTFILTPITYKLYFPQEKKTNTSLFWFGLGMNIFVGNLVAITQQALWGRSLDYLAKHGNINYSNIIKEGLEKEGMKAFFTPPKWASRVMMNAPAQGVLPWFYNEILPMGEDTVIRAVKKFAYDPFSAEVEILKEARRPIETASIMALPTDANYTANSPRQ
jgi:hypothetical protein